MEPGDPIDPTFRVWDGHKYKMALTSTFLIAFLNIHTREKNTSPIYIYIAYVLVPQIISLLTLASIHTLYEDSTTGGIFILQLVAREVGSREVTVGY